MSSYDAFKNPKILSSKDSKFKNDVASTLDPRLQKLVHLMAVSCGDTRITEEGSSPRRRAVAEAELQKKVIKLIMKKQRELRKNSK